MICLDTNAVIAILNGRPKVARGHFAAAEKTGAQIAISPIVLFELWYGVAKSSRPDTNADRIRTFLSDFIEILPFEPEDAEAAAHLRALLEKADTPIGPFDLLIAAQAVRRGAALGTANAREFDRVPNLVRLDCTADL
jgi:tRNA(fMet)-specific endonuclease VapC